MTARRVLTAGAAMTATVIGLVVLLPAVGVADVFDNVAPASQLPGGALMDRYPLGAYLLDHHFDAVKAGVLSGVDVSGIPPTIAWFLAQLLWQLTALLAYATITVFTFAFSLDLVNGSAATGGNGALAPVSDAIQTIYGSVFGAPWLTAAIVVTGMWAMWQSLVRRRHVQTLGALGMSLLYVIVALAFVTQPERTIGQASRWTNELSGAFLSLSANGTVTDHDDAKREVSDQLFKLLVHDPWVVLNFGGLEHCVNGVGDSVPVRPLSSNPARDAQLARQLARGGQVQGDGKTCVSNAAKYAPHFLRFGFESEERNDEYEALKAGDTGKLPDADPGKRDGTYRLGAIDEPAAEAMSKGGQYQRLGLAFVIFIGELGVFLLLGSLSIAVTVAQVIALLLLACAPIVLVIAVFPGRGHDFFIRWLQRLAALVLRKAVMSLILAVLLSVSAALQVATSNLGWLMAFGLQAAFFWTVFLSRHTLVGQLSGALTGTSDRGEDSARLTAGAVVAGYAAGRLGKRGLAAIRRTRRGAGPTPPPEPPPPLPPQPQPPRPEPPPRPDHGPAGDRPSDGAGRSSNSAGDNEPPPQPASGTGSSSTGPPNSSTERRSAENPVGLVPPPSTPSVVEQARGQDTAASGDQRRADAERGDRRDRPAPPRRGPAEPPPAAAPTPAAPAASSAGQPEPHVAAAPAADGASPLLARLRHDAQRMRAEARRSTEQRDRAPGAAPPRARTGGERA